MDETKWPVPTGFQEHRRHLRIPREPRGLGAGILEIDSLEGLTTNTPFKERDKTRLLG